ncbi:helix-turn-helix domain-containing protein [Sphingobacterium hotanense]|uniref:helix-turn-helix domain-containing protein n=1 Tax=Sphingobacterium hotanense TaxID=649196 RepID=UPI0021A446EB|nr:helix-turn-helix transcriptional regulator [Sphingobacterium hotanense]MCT1525698.1 helix-turn-helix domain-containing protein [Sphingobacterium hotanense]
MTFGQRLIALRKAKKLSQGDLGKKVGTSGDIIGKYERGENIPSIDVAAKMAEALGVTLDYLVKDGEYEHIDNEMLKRLKEVQGLDDENRAQIFATIDAFIKAAKLKSIAAL